MPREMIEAFGEEGDFSRQHLLNPTIFSLLGDAAGLQILDAGCGNGYLSRMLAKRGATVTGVEPATALVQYAIEREANEPQGITYYEADLTRWRSTQRFDAVIANMVLMDIADYEAALDSCLYHLREGGKFIFSLTHPCFEASDSQFREIGHIAVKSYFEQVELEQQWGNRFHRPLSDYLNALIQRGGIISAVVEPQLDPSKAQYPLAIERNLHVPAFIVICVRKAGTMFII